MREARRYVGLLAIVVLAIFATDPNAGAWPGSGWYGGNGGTIASPSAAGVPVAQFGCSPSNADNSGCLATAVTYSGTNGVPVFVQPGTYNVNNPVSVPSGAQLQGAPGVIFKGGITPGSPTQAIFTASPTYGAFSTSFASTPAVGALTVSLTAAPGGGYAAGQMYSFASTGTGYGQFATIRTVASASGAGPYSVTLNEPIPFPFVASNALVQQVTARPQNITIRANGAKFTGAGSRYIELVGCLNCYVYDALADESGGSLSNGALAFSFDLASQHCGWIRCTANLPHASVDFIAEGGEGILMDHTVGIGAQAEGLAFFDTVDSTMRACSGWGNAYGAGFDSNDLCGSLPATDFCGCARDVLEGGYFYDNSIAGVGIGASYEGKVVGVTSAFNGIGGSGDGVDLGISGSAAPQSTSIVNAVLANNTNLGVNANVTASAVGLNLSGVTFDSNGGGDLNTEIGVNLSGVTVKPTGGNVTSLFFNGGASYVNGLTTITQSGTHGVMIYVQSGTVNVENGHVSIAVAPTAAEYAVDAAGGSAAFSNFLVDGAGASNANVVGFNVTATGSVSFGANVNPTACATPIAQTTGGVIAAAPTPGVYSTGTAGAIALPWSLFFSQNFIFSNATETANVVYSLPLTGGSTGTGLQPGAFWTLVNNTTGGFAIALKYTSESDGGCSCSAGHTCLCVSNRNGNLSNITGP